VTAAEREFLAKGHATTYERKAREALL